MYNLIDLIDNFIVMLIRRHEEVYGNTIDMNQF